MISRVIEEIKIKYIHVIFLVIYICIFLGMASYECMYINNGKTGVVLNETKLELNQGLLDEKYITREDLTLNFSNSVFYDKISRKLIITTWDDILKVKVGDSIVKEQDGMLWYNIQEIADYFEYKSFKDTKSNSIYIYKWNEIEASINKNRTEVYKSNTLDVIGIVEGKNSITIFLDEKAYNNDVEYFTVKVVEAAGDSYVGRIRKTAVSCELPPLVENKGQETKIIMTSVSKSVSSGTDLTKVNTLAVDMLRISSENNVIEETYSLARLLKQDIYAVLTNGYKLAGFDSSILSNIITSDVNKENISNQILNYLATHNLKGLIIDFKSFKVSDKELLEQYIKELSALLHKNDKKIMIKTNDISSYNLNNIKEYVDYFVVQAYGARTTASKISGSHSTISYVQNMLESFNEKIYSNKIILELAPYSILWTERAGTVINAEVYSMDACTQYIKVNDIEVVFDKVSGQNIINFTKGIITYKMWLEDKTSIAKKLEVANAMNVAGFAIYRSGYENKSVYTVFNLEEENK